jgi:hypothetical protein
MKVLFHHIYEYKRGLRNLVLHTISSDLRVIAEEKLLKNSIPFIIRKVNEKKVNIFFGAKECVKVIESFGDKCLSEFSVEEDFILGIMLGYNRIEQCKRYIKRKYGNYINIPSIKCLKITEQQKVLSS